MKDKIVVGERYKAEPVSVREETSLEVVLSRGRRIGVRPGF
jgi:hypothetical protein